MTEIERKALIETVRLEAELNANYDGTAFKLLHRIGRCIEADGKHIDALVAEIARLRAGIAEVQARGVAMQNEANFDREKYDTGLGWECAGEWLEAFAQETQP